MSLKKCLVSLAAPLRDFDTETVVEAARDYQAQGMDQKAAELKAIADHLRMLQGEKKRIEGIVIEAFKASDPEGFQESGAKRKEKPGTKAAPTVSKATVFTDEAADRARELLRKKLGNLNAGIDPEVIQAGITIAGNHIERGARTFAAYARAMIADLGEMVRPYLKSWYMGVKYDPRASAFDGMSSAAEVEAADIDAILDEGEADDVSSPAGTAEPDSGVEPAQDGVVPTAVQPAAEPPARRPGTAGGGARGGRGAAAGGAVVSGDRPAAGGERGNQPFHSENGRSGAPTAATGSDQPGRGADDGRQGAPAQREESQAVGDAVRRTAPKLTLSEKRKAQRDAESIEVIPADPANIAATLPFLLNSQHEDVAFAERRFTKPDGYGVLFTNGTGTGKTYLALGVIKRMVKQGKKNGLIVVPSQKIIDDWILSADNLGLQLNRLESTEDKGRGVAITTYANFGENMTLADRDYDFVVCDEAHSLMQSENAQFTSALQTLRAITLHPDAMHARTAMLHRDLYAERQALSAAREEARKRGDTAAFSKAEEAYEASLARIREKQDQIRDDIAARQGEARPRALFLSATPFAYEKNVQWAEGYLFEFTRGEVRLGNSNQGGYEQFMVQHFGYRIRYHKLTEPGPEVNRDLMQRQFNTWLRQQGVLSARTLDVDQDYDRKFIYIDSKIGHAIDEGLRWLNETDGGRYRALYDIVRKKFAFLQRSRLLEALKAREMVPYIQKQLDLGRKIVVFYDYNEGGSFDVFDLKEVSDSETGPVVVTYYPPRKPDEADAAVGLPFGVGEGVQVELNQLIREFRSQRPDLVELNTLANSPLATLKAAFPQAVEYNGNIPPKRRTEFVNAFNNDQMPEVNLILAQKAANAGWSAHDTTGKHPRVLINLGLPTAPTVAIQQEGRIYRVGQASDAMFRYVNTGTSWERMAFAEKMARRAGTAENLAMGEDARGLTDSFIEAFESAEVEEPGGENDGKGGKARDRALASVLTEFERAKTYYYAQLKRNSKTKAAEGEDYFATPEPVGLMMTTWARIRPGESLLEPSAGHGAIARWFPDNHARTVIEQSPELASKLALVTDAQLVNGRFEEWHIVNKRDVIVMNPPFGLGGAKAIPHLDKAFMHLPNGGRIVAIIPTGPAADKRFEKWLYEEDVPEKDRKRRDAHLVTEIRLPNVTFKRAGTQVPTHIVIIDKQSDPNLVTNQRSIDLSSAEDIEELFARIENIDGPPRSGITEAARLTQAEIDGTGPVIETSGASETAEAPVAAGGMQKAEFKHTKTGETVFIAKPTTHLGDDFKAISAIAKGEGGWWNSYASGGAIKGFAFKSQAARDAFIEKVTPKFSMPADTPAFRRWFGDSKVVDSDGNPLVVYHGTGKNFSEFVTGASSYFGPGGIFFTDSPSAASAFAKQSIDHPNVMPVLLRMENPYVVDFEENGDDVTIEGLKARGFDGIIRPSETEEGEPDTVYVVFYGGQIKSAIGNRGTFDPSSPNILESSRPGARPRGITVATVRAAIAPALSKVSRAAGLEVTVVENNEALPAFIRARIRPGKYPHGVTVGNQVYLIAGNLSGTREARIALAHEIFGHVGPEAAIDDWAEVSARVVDLEATSRRAKDIADDVRDRYPDADQATFTREFLALAAERVHAGPVALLLSRVRAALRRFLSRMGIGGVLEDADIDVWLADGARYLRTGDNRAGLAPSVAFSTGRDDGLQSEDGDADRRVQEREDSGRLGAGRPVSGRDQVRRARLDRSSADPDWAEKTRARGAAGPITLFRGATRPHSPADFERASLGKNSRSPTAGLGVFYSESEIEAGDYGFVERFNLDIRNPYISKHRNLPQFDSIEQAYRWREKLRAKGYDSIVLQDRELGAISNIIVFEPSQVLPIPKDPLQFSMPPAVTQTIEFKRWFGDSKVVAYDGSPLRVFRGSERADVGDGATFFTDDDLTAESYGKVSEAYLNIQNPLVVNWGGAKWNVGLWRNGKRIASEPEDLIPLAKKNGRDGVIISDVIDVSDDYDFDKYGAPEPSTVYVVFNKDQVWSESSPADPRINFSMPREQPPLFGEGFDLPSETLFDYLVRNLQDRFRRVKMVQRAIEKAGGRISEETNAYLKEEIFHGKVSATIEAFMTKVVDPLVASMKAANVTLEELDEYLYAKHAPERNARIAEIRKDMQDGGSGMTDQEAADYMAALPPKMQRQLEALAQRVYAMNRARLDMIEAAGLESPQQIDLWRTGYEFYVPLRGFTEEEKASESVVSAVARRVGRGFDIRGKESKRALGRRSQADSPLLYSVLQMQETIVRSAKNEVGQAFLKLVLDNPNPDLWTVHTGQWGDYKAAWDAKSGEVVYRRDPLSRLGENVLSVKMDGKEHFIVLEDEGHLLARAFKNLGVDSSNVVIRFLAGYNRYMAAINTSLNPEFVITNFARDLQTAIINLVGEQDAQGALREPQKMGRKVLKDIPNAMRGAFLGLYNKEPGNEWVKWFNEFRGAGGMINFYSLQDLEGLRAEIQRGIDSSRAGAPVRVLELVRTLGKHMANTNAAVENGVRLSTYVNARRAGMSRDQAASLARNVTVNFTRKGEFGTVANSLYLFYNASLQGSVRLLYAVTKSKRVRKILAGIAGSAFAWAILNRLIGGDDDDGENRYDKIPNYIKTRNIIFMRPDGSYWKFPLPYGYNVPWVLGTYLENAIAHPDRKMESAVVLGQAILESFNPIGGLESEDPFKAMAKLASPTIADPWIELAINEDWSGRPIQREQPSWGAPLPDSQLYWSSVSMSSKAVTTALNDLTGGNEVMPGAVDINPETLDHLFSAFTGGLGRAVISVVDLPATALSPEEVRPGQIPFYRRFRGEPSDSYTYQRYDEIKDAVQLYSKRVKALQQDADTRDQARAYRAENELLRIMEPYVRNSEARLTALYRERKAIDRSRLDPETKRLRMKRKDEEIEAVRKRAIGRYNELRKRKDAA